MKILALIVCAIAAFIGIAYGGATTVYPIFQATTGQNYAFINGLASAGDTTVVAVTNSQVLKLKRIDFKPDASVTGTINIKIGSTVVYAIHNAVVDNVYGKNLNLDYNEGVLGGDLVINSPAVVRYNADYRVN